MNIISIDSAKAHIGIYIKTNKEYHETITTTKLNNDNEKYQHIYIRITDLCLDNKIEVAFLEDYPFSIGNSRSITALAEVKGIILLALYNQNIKIIKVNPSTWQAMVKLELPKKQKAKVYIEAVNKFYNKSFESTDECDAYMMLISMYYIYKGVVKTDSHLKLQKKMMAVGDIF